MKRTFLLLIFPLLFHYAHAQNGIISIARYNGSTTTRASSALAWCDWTVLS